MKRGFGVRAGLMALACMGAIGLSAANASAAVDFGVTAINVGFDNSPRLHIFSASRLYTAHGSAWGANCGTVSADTLKLWESLGQAAVLSGRPLDIDYTTNTTCQPGYTLYIITAVHLRAQ